LPPVSPPAGAVEGDAGKIDLARWILKAGNGSGWHCRAVDAQRAATGEIDRTGQSPAHPEILTVSENG
jgi:hypothetical protein